MTLDAAPSALGEGEFQVTLEYKDKDFPFMFFWNAHSMISRTFQYKHLQKPMQYFIGFEGPKNKNE